MPDAIDAAQAACEQNTQDAIDAHRAARSARSSRNGCRTPGIRICIGCDELIPDQRLKVEPHTKFCQSCGTEMEKQLKRDSAWM